MQPALTVLTRFAEGDWAPLVEWLVSWGNHDDLMPACGLVMRAVLEGGGQEAAALVRQQFLDPANSHRAALRPVAWLGLSGSPRAAGLLCEALPAAEPQVRTVIEQALARLGAEC